MAAILGIDDKEVENICALIKDAVVVPANYNSPGQLVISGSEQGVAIACEKILAAGAKRALPLKVGGAFHSPLMEPARVELAEAIHATKFNKGMCPIYQNVTGQSVTDPEIIKKNLIAQLTAPVRWTHIMNNMIASGVKTVVEVGPGTVLQGLFKKVDRNLEVSSATV
jgi:[acyl-carrier-protein] S-malonyltransferase